MLYKTLVQTLEKVAATPSKLEKTDIVAPLLNEAADDELVALSRLMIGKLFPEWEFQDLGVSEKTVLKILIDMSGLSEKKIVEIHKKTGDLGAVAEVALGSKMQRGLFGSHAMSVNDVYGTLMKVAVASGKNSQATKQQIMRGMLLHMGPAEAKYVIRAILQMMQTGFSTGLLEDAIVKAFGVSKEIIHNAYMYLPDYGEIARLAKRGEDQLKKVQIAIFRPIKPMLALSAASAEEIVKEFGEAAYEYKYDGVRMQIHRKGDKTAIYTRKLNDVTPQFPDLVKMAISTKPTEYIIEGELLAIKDGRALPFQELSKRVRRIYDIQKMLKSIPIKFLAFDALYLKGQDLTKLKYKDRYVKLTGIVRDSKLDLAKRIVSKNPEEVKAFFDESKSDGNEGLMAKDLNAAYSPGQRGKKMLKLKGILDTLDVTIVKAEYGEGRKGREGWLSRLHIAAKSGDKYLIVGKVSSGLSDEELGQITKELKKNAIKEEGRFVTVNPTIVLEIAFDEIQKGDHYDSGYGIRFPRVIRIRDDKGVDEVDSVEKIKDLYKKQFENA